MLLHLFAVESKLAIDVSAPGSQADGSFRAVDFTEVFLKSMAYSLSGRACQFLFLAMSLSGSQSGRD